MLCFASKSISAPALLLPGVRFSRKDMATERRLEFKMRCLHGTKITAWFKHPSTSGISLEANEIRWYGRCACGKKIYRSYWLDDDYQEVESGKEPLSELQINILKDIQKISDTINTEIKKRRGNAQKNQVV